MREIILEKLKNEKRSTCLIGHYDTAPTNVQCRPDSYTDIGEYDDDSEIFLTWTNANDGSGSGIHTHYAEIEQFKSTLLINPGSPTMPNYMPQLGTVGLLTLKDGKFDAKIIPLA